MGPPGGSRKAAWGASNEYCGWRGAGTGGIRVLAEAPSPETFWAEYISQRRPVVIRCHPQDAEWLATERWTDRYLIQTAGDAQLLVEERLPGEAFGKGKKVPQTFAQVVKQCRAGDDSHYLTTQEVAMRDGGLPELYAAPLSQLVHDVPLRPRLLGNLVPHQLNLWMGASQNGASSGLHHDHHDNLYVLLRGLKRFRLYSPAEAERMYTHGVIRKVYPNGRIIFQEQPQTRADGAEESRVGAWERQSAAEAAAAAAAAAAARGARGAAAAQRAAQEALEDAMDEALLDAAEFGGDDDWDDAFMDSDEEDAFGSGEVKGAGAGVAAVDESDVDPLNFSQVDLALPEVELARRFPRFPGKQAALECSVAAGEMLYLPAGWFHEVTSFSLPNAPGGHLALNYWLHPPDQLEASARGFAAPYRSPYWAAMWAAAGFQSGWQARVDSAALRNNNADSTDSGPPPRQEAKQAASGRDSGCKGRQRGINKRPRARGWPYSRMMTADGVFPRLNVITRVCVPGLALEARRVVREPPSE